jgi:hypothetical protein
MVRDLVLGAIEAEMPAWTLELLPCLSSRQRQAFLLRSTGVLFDEIGDRLGISGSRASQLYNTAVEILTAAARRGALLTLHAPPIVPHHPPDRAAERCLVPVELTGLLDLSVETLVLGARAREALAFGRINIIGDLIAKTEGELLRVPRIGRITLRELKAALAAVGLHLGMSVEVGTGAETPSHR